MDSSKTEPATRYGPATWSVRRGIGWVSGTTFDATSSMRLEERFACHILLLTVEVAPVVNAWRNADLSEASRAAPAAIRQDLPGPAQARRPN